MEYTAARGSTSRRSTYVQPPVISIRQACRLAGHLERLKASVPRADGVPLPAFSGDSSWRCRVIATGAVPLPGTYPGYTSLVRGTAC